MSDRVFKQAGFDSASTVERAEFEMRCIPIGDQIALVMPVEGWAELLTAMYSVRDHNAVLDTLYEGMKYGMGFVRVDEALQPEQPEIES